MDASEFLSPRSLSSTLLSQTPRSENGVISRSTRSLASRFNSTEQPGKASQEMLASFAGRFDSALRNSAAEESATAAAPGSAELIAAASGATSSARRRRQPVIMVCRELVAQAVSSSELLELQQLSREHSRRPCEVYRSAMLDASMALLEGAAPADNGAREGATDDELLARMELAALASAVTAAGGGRSGGGTSGAEGSEGGANGGQGGPSKEADPLAHALTARLMRAVGLQLGPKIYASIRRGVERRDHLLTESEAQVRTAQRAHPLSPFGRVPATASTCRLYPRSRVTHSLPPRFSCRRRPLCSPASSRCATSRRAREHSLSRPRSVAASAHAPS